MTSYLKGIKNPLEKDEVGIIDLWLLCDIFDLHLRLLLVVFLFGAVLQFLLLGLLLPLLGSLLFALLLAVSALTVFLRRKLITEFRVFTHFTTRKKLVGFRKNAKKCGWFDDR